MNKLPVDGRLVLGGDIYSRPYSLNVNITISISNDMLTLNEKNER